MSVQAMPTKTAAKKAPKSTRKTAKGGKPKGAQAGAKGAATAGQRRKSAGPKAPNAERSPGPRRAVRKEAADRMGISENERHYRIAQHEHEDPRIEQAGIQATGKAHRDPRKEYGLSKDRVVSRLKPMGNWFRRAPKHKSP